MSIHKGFGVNGCAVFADGEMQVGVLPDLEQRRAPDGADRLPSLDLVPGGDNGCGGQILIVRDAAVVVPDDDRRAEQLVVIDRRDRAVCRGPYRRALGGGQVCISAMCVLNSSGTSSLYVTP